MTRTLATAVLSLGVLPLVLAQSSTSIDDVLVLERSANLWYENAFTRVTVSPDGTRAIFFAGLGDTHLYSLATRREEPENLRGDLDRVDAAGFCGPDGFLRLGSRGSESGIFVSRANASQLLSLPQDARASCSPDGKKIAYYRANEPDRAVYVGAPGNYREYPLGGKLTAMTFSPNGEIFYHLDFQPNGESAFSSIELRSGASHIIANHLDGTATSTSISVAPDRKHAYLPLVSEAPPNNEARHKPDADRWLKIYEVNGVDRRAAKPGRIDRLRSEQPACGQR